MSIHGRIATRGEGKGRGAASLVERASLAAGTPRSGSLCQASLIGSTRKTWFSSRTESHMKMPYTFALVRYVHDPVAGEALNVGGLLFSPGERFLDVKLAYRFERFSATFARFDGERFKQGLRHFACAVDNASE